MTAPTCRPPEGTPDGTPCWLYHDPPGRPREWIVLRWFHQGVWSGIHDVSATRAARFGWRFHSIAEAPDA